MQVKGRQTEDKQERMKGFLFSTFTQKLMKFQGVYGRNGDEEEEGFIH